MAEKDLLLGALKVFSFFDGAADIKFSYNFKCTEYDELINKYNLLNVIGNGSTLEKVIRLMEWCSQNVLHNRGTKNVEFLEKKFFKHSRLFISKRQRIWCILQITGNSIYRMLSCFRN